MTEQAFVNGNDDRLEFFELTDPEQQVLMSQSIVGLMPEATLRPLLSGDLGRVATWGETSRLCPDEPFVNQPAAAFCSGVLLDWDLPGRDGLTVLRGLASDGGLTHAKVVMLTFRASEREILSTLEIGAVDHVAKPFSVPVLMQRVRRLLGQ